MCRDECNDFAADARYELWRRGYSGDRVDCWQACDAMDSGRYRDGHDYGAALARREDAARERRREEREQEEYDYYYVQQEQQQYEEMMLAAYMEQFGNGPMPHEDQPEGGSDGR